MWIIKNKQHPELYWHSGGGWMQRINCTLFPDYLKQKLPLPADGEWEQVELLVEYPHFIPIKEGGEDETA